MTVETIVRGTTVTDRRRRLCEQLGAPVQGMNETIRRGSRNIFLFYTGLDEAVHNSPSALDHARELETEPYYAGLAWLVRLFYHLQAGDFRAMEQARVQMELQSLRHLDNDQHFTAGLVYEATLLSRYDDLLGFKRLLPSFNSWAERFPGWRPWAAYVNATYALLRDDVDKATALIEGAREYMEPCTHGAWHHLHLLHMRVLLRQDRAAQAVVLGEWLEAKLAEHAVVPLEPTVYPVQLALARAHVGLHEQAAARVDELIRNIDVNSSSVSRRGVLYEARAHRHARRRRRGVPRVCGAYR